MPEIQGGYKTVNDVTVTTAQLHIHNDVIKEPVFNPVTTSRPISASLNDIAVGEFKPPVSRILSDSVVAPDASSHLRHSDDQTTNQNSFDTIYGHLPVDEGKLEVMSKKQVVAHWLESEFELRKRLEQMTKENQDLGSKLLYLQSFIRKPP